MKCKFGDDPILEVTPLYCAPCAERPASSLGSVLLLTKTLRQAQDKPLERCATQILKLREMGLGDQSRQSTQAKRGLLGLTTMSNHAAKKIEQEVDSPSILRQAPLNETVSRRLGG